MRATCPHCGATNEFARPPSTSIVYCRSCGKPFGRGAFDQDTMRRPDRQRPASGPGPAVALGAGGEGWKDPTGRIQVAASATDPATIIVQEGRSQARAVAKVVHLSPDGMETAFDLTGPTSVGRHPTNEIRLNDREISKHHALLEERDGGWFVRDTQSSNGTFVNGRRVKESPLQHGDELHLGSMRLSFRIEQPESSRGTMRDLVTILPQEPGGTTHIHAKLAGNDLDFRPVAEVTDLELLKRDYEKLRLTHELSRIGLNTDIKSLLTKTMDVVFGMLPADSGVIMLVDEDTHTLVPHTVRQRSGGVQEILLSSTIVNAALRERASVLSSDAFLDPRFSGAESIIAQGIRAAMCVPLVAHDKVLGLMHLDSRERVGAFTEKDLQLLKAIATQTAIAIENVRLLRQVEQEAQTRGQLSRFLPPHVVEEMVKGRGRPIQKGGRELEATVVFCDIRGFTSLSESVGPQDVVELLNEYFEVLVEIVFRRHGVLDKFIGDALMASWGTLEGEDTGDAAFQAVAAALDFRDAIRRLNAERADRSLMPIQMGVGVNTGRLVAGYMGAKRRLEFTVIGDTVNTASRICGIAQGDQVLLSEATLRYVASRIEARYLGVRRVKGREQDVGVYEAARLLA